MYFHSFSLITLYKVTDLGCSAVACIFFSSALFTKTLTFIINHLKSPSHVSIYNRVHSNNIILF